MIFRIADCKTLLLASLVFGLLSAASGQPAGGTQHIVFSSPDGQITTNVPLPMVQAPEPRARPDLPAGNVAVHEFGDPLVAPMYPLPMLQQPNAQSRDDSLDSRDIREKMGVLTPAQIMNVPTPEQIFGLPDKKAADAQKEPWQLDYENRATNTDNPNSDTTAMLAEPSWAKLWAQNPEKSSQSSNTTDKASGFFSKFFESGQNDTGFGDHDHNGNSDDTFWGSSQPAPQQSSWDSAMAGGGFTPASAMEAVPNNFTPVVQSTPDLTPQSPFATPQVSTLGTMPKLPSLPSLPGRNQLPQLPSTPSWGPKPPPWTQSQTPFGTPVQSNPALKR